MKINGEETDILRSYRSMDVEGRLAIMRSSQRSFAELRRRYSTKSKQSRNTCEAIQEMNLV